MKHANISLQSLRFLFKHPKLQSGTPQRQMLKTQNILVILLILTCHQVTKQSAVTMDHMWMLFGKAWSALKHLQTPQKAWIPWTPSFVCAAFLDVHLEISALPGTRRTG